MNISINPQNQERIRRKLEDGRYGSPDAVIAKALELLDLHDEELERELADLRSKVRRGTKQADAGQLTSACFVPLRPYLAIPKAPVCEKVMNLGNRIKVTKPESSTGFVTVHEM